MNLILLTPQETLFFKFRYFGVNLFESSWISNLCIYIGKEKYIFSVIWIILEKMQIKWKQFRYILKLKLKFFYTGIELLI